MRHLALIAIRCYQCFLSPYKGFRCAYGVHTGRTGCSGLGYRAIRRLGLIAGLLVLNKRLRLCGVAHRRFSASIHRPLARQRGDCDPGCVGCDLPDIGGKSTDLPGKALTCLECGSCCDWPRRGKGGDRNESMVYIPPHSKF